MPQQFVLSIDQGTTGSTVLIVDDQGSIVTSVNEEFPVYFPKPGWVEQDPTEIWENVQSVIAKALTEANLTHGDIAAIGITNQRETTILWDRKTGEPLGRAIVWQDRRTSAFCQQLREDGHEDLFQRKTGLMLDPYFSGTKLRWRFDDDPSIYERAQAGEIAFGTVDSWLLYKFTGDHLTDFTNASRTLLYDIGEKRWDDELCKVLDVPMGILPSVKNAGDDFGTTQGTSFGGVEVPILAVAGDQQAALFGHFGFQPGDSKNTYGTGSFAVANVGETFSGPAGGLLTTLGISAEGTPVYALEGSIFTTGAAVKWLRDDLKAVTSAGETETLARSVPDSGGVYMVPSFVGFGSPYWDADARAALLGVTLGTTTAHIARAVLEGIAYQVKDVIDAMEREGEQEITRLAVDGGATQNDFLMQFQADILGIPVIKRSVQETTGYGTALLAGLRAGVFNLDAVQKTVTVVREFTPSMSDEHRASLYEGWQRAVAATRTFKV